MPREKKDAPVSVRLTPTSAKIWEALADHWGQSKVAVLERLLRDAARSENISIADVDREVAEESPTSVVAGA